MERSTDELLEQGVAALDTLIQTAATRGLTDSAHFLGMAKLQLQLDLHGITDQEFIALCDALETRLRQTGGRKASYPRPRREGDLRGQRRAWQCPQDITPRRLRGGRA